MRRLHHRLAAVLIAMAAVILILSTVSSLWSIHYHLTMYRHQQSAEGAAADSAGLTGFGGHLEQALMQSTLLTFLGALSIAALLGYYVAKRVSAPLVEMKRGAERMAKGEWGSRVRVRGEDELAQLAGSLNGLGEQLQVQQQLRLTMSQDVAHELRTPLATLKSHLIALEDGIWEPTPSRLRACSEEVERLIALVAELEELHAMDAPDFRLRLEPKPLAPVIGKAAEITEAAYARKGVGLRVRMDSEACVDMDDSRMLQVLLNLLTNALAHTEPGGEVRIELAEEGGQVTVDLRDTGPGIPSEDLPYIFERFYRGDKSRTRKSGGSGIGLAIVHKLVAAHGGQVWAENDGGAVFRVRLPLHRDEGREPYL
ncbi:sensor histidine kinase [Paenibacillus aurantiacus]|uniref:histidine kinase n=1 Tax=Paenibacillus aurantiacus TaxID=1936118 RepID=A0ABV5KPB2_9BACL